MERRTAAALSTMLDRALTAARKALRDLDADQVPASLRRVVAHSGQLTPPLARVLIREIDSLQWLRERALEAWPEAAASVDDPQDGASALFLSRPEGWVIRLAEAAAMAGRSAVAHEAQGVAKERDEARSSLETARERERAARSRIDALQAEVRSLKKRLSEPVRAENARAARAADAEAREREAWHEERRALQERAAALEQGMADLRESLYRVEQDRAAAVRRLEEARGSAAWGVADAVELGALIDAAAAQARPMARDTAPTQQTIDGFSLPVGVRPDDARAVNALLSHRGPLRVVVDGYNAALHGWGGTPAEVRARLRAVLERFVVVAPPAVTVGVVWDSTLDEGGLTRRGRLEERFADGGREADDVIIEMASTSTVPVVVVSSDRAVRERCSAVGAVALWSEALVGWATERR